MQITVNPAVNQRPVANAGADQTVASGAGVTLNGTGSTDPENEALIQRAFSKLAAGRTVIMIAHRLSTVVGADQIVVLNQGSVQEAGTHAELLSQKGLYAKMWAEYEQAASWKITAATADAAVTKGGEA